MPKSVFLRLLKTPPDEKGSALAALITALNNPSSPCPVGEGPGVREPATPRPAGEGPGVRAFTLDPADFSLIPGSPFAYWASRSIRETFVKLPSVASSGISPQVGLSTKDDFRFLRLWFEPDPGRVGSSLEDTTRGRIWIPFAKGGAFSPFYADVHLLLNWANGGQEIEQYVLQKYPYLKGNAAWVLHPESSYFRPGLTWPRRTTSGISVRALPAGCIFADKGPSAFTASDEEADLLALLAVMNSSAFAALVKLQLGAATAAARSYEVGVIQRTPVPPLEGAARDRLAALAREAHDLQRDRDRADETTHAFCLPSLARYRQGSLLQAGQALEAEEQARQHRLAEIQAEIDDIVFDLYGMDEADRALVLAEMEGSHGGTEDTEQLEEGLENLRASVANHSHGGTEDTEQLEEALENLRASVANHSHGGTEDTEQLEEALENLRASVANHSHGGTEDTEQLEEALENLRASVANHSHRGTEQSEQDSHNLRALRASVANHSHGGTEQSEQDSDNLRALRASVANHSHGGTEQSEQDSDNLRALRASVADDEEEAALLEDMPTRVQNLLMWCVGVAFGRWDIRMALDPSRLPPLGGPFDPLPRCALGALVGPDGLPVTKRSPGYADAGDAKRSEGSTGDARHLGTSSAAPYPLPIPWDGILVDDPTHPSDIVARVRKVLDLVWGDRSDTIEQEACRILGVRDLREWFRDPRKGFFAFHIKRYSKSRRKAPIYWLLQSEKRHYAIWIYCHRMRQDVLYAAGRSYADYKIVFERNHLEDLRADLESLSGSARRNREREIERQQKVIDDVVAFGKRLDAAALLDIPPDLNDGILISMAPLRELVPWSEVARMWESLRAGQYPWSTMSQQMRKKGLVKGLAHRPLRGGNTWAS